jgi:biotin transport system substrate-specific component
MAASAATLPVPHRGAALADLLPASSRAGAIAREAVLVLGGAAAVGASAQVAFTIPQISPVPFVLTTLTVLLLGAAYGPLRAGATLGLYLAAGMAGVPWFSDGASGYAIATLGYVVGFLAAGVAVGWLARRGADRTIARTVGLMVIGNIVIYAFGVPYLAVATGMDAATAVAKGMLPFLAGDFLKLVVAALLLPGAWFAVKKLRPEPGDR